MRYNMSVKPLLGCYVANIRMANCQIRSELLQLSYGAQVPHFNRRGHMVEICSGD